MISHKLLGLADDPQFLNAAVALSVPQSQAPQATPSYSRIYAFGDSLSDAGNDYTVSGGLLPTPLIYSDGRFTNGPVWVQDLATGLHASPVTPSLTGGTDYAYGGAEAGNEPLHAVSPIDLPSQLAQFLVNVGHAPSNALYTLSIGGNDVIGAISAAPNVALNDINVAVADEVRFIKALIADGARNFLVMNVPDLGRTPEESAHATLATKLSLFYDNKLSAGLNALAAADHVSIDILNAFGLIDHAVRDPSLFGLKNSTTPVWTGNFENPLSGTLNAHGAAQNGYLFFDHLHPTAHGHQIVATAALQALQHTL